MSLMMLHSGMISLNQWYSQVDTIVDVAIMIFIAHLCDPWLELQVASIAFASCPSKDSFTKCLAILLGLPLIVDSLFPTDGLRSGYTFLYQPARCYVNACSRVIK